MTRQSTVDWERDIYAKGRQLNRWPFSDLVSAVLRESSERPRDKIRILEIGCGAGNNVWFLAEEGYAAYGIDGSPSAIAYAQARLTALGLSADLRAGDITALPYDDDSFDLVLDRGAVTQNDYAAVRRIFSDVMRVLKPGGTFMLFDLFGMDSPDKRFGTEVSQNTYDHFTEGSFQRVGLTSFFTFDDLSTLLQDFSDVRISRRVSTDSQRRVVDDGYDAVAVKPSRKA